MSEYQIPENGVATIGRFRVALAHTRTDTREGASLPGAWLSIVEKGSDLGQRDVDVVLGDTVALGERSFRVSAVVLSDEAAGGSVTLTGE